jgi:hypothetical protein
LAFEFEKTLTQINKLQKRLIQTIIPNDNQFVHDLRELVSDIPRFFRAHFRELLSTVSPVNSDDYDDADIKQLDKRFRELVQKSWKEFELDWKTKLMSLTKAVQIKEELVLYYKDCPDVVSFVEDTFASYYNKITKQFAKQKHAIQHHADYLWFQYDKCEALCYLEIW